MIVPLRCTTARRASKPTTDVAMLSRDSRYGTRRFSVSLAAYSRLSQIELFDNAMADYFVDVDFNQALIIDPDNVLVERCLAAAKQKSVVMF